MAGDNPSQAAGAQPTAENAPDVAIRVLAFAGARDVTGVSELELPLAEIGPEHTAGAVMDALVGRYPELGDFRRIIRLAVNGTYVEPGAPVAAGDEVALIPPVAGG